MSEWSAEELALEIDLHGCTCVPQHSGLSQALIVKKGSVRLCQEHEDIARALAEKDAEVAEARRERDADRATSLVVVKSYDARVAALEADLAAMRGHVRTIQDQHRCGQEHVEHEYPCDICNAIHDAIASSPGAAR